MSKMDITGLDKARVLKALWDHSMNDLMSALSGLLGVNPPKMSVEEAREIIKQSNGNLYFDYIKARVIKTDIKPNFIDLSLYNRDNGYNAGENAILEEFTRPDGQ